MSSSAAPHVAAGQLAARRARQQADTAGPVEHTHHPSSRDGRDGTQHATSRCENNPVRGSSAAPVHDFHHRPAARSSARDVVPQRPRRQHLEAGARRHQHTRRTVAPGPLGDHLPGAPTSGRAPRGTPRRGRRARPPPPGRQGGEGGGPVPDRDASSGAGPGPLVGQHRHRAPLQRAAAGPVRRAARLRRRQHEHAAGVARRRSRAAAAAASGQGSAAGPMRSTDAPPESTWSTATATAASARGWRPAIGAPSGAAAAIAGAGARGPVARRRAQERRHRSRPPPRRPLRHVRGPPVAGPTPARPPTAASATPGGGSTSSSITQPPTRAPAPAPRAPGFPTRTSAATDAGDRVVEGLAHARHVGHDSRHPVGRAARRGAPRPALGSDTAVAMRQSDAPVVTGARRATGRGRASSRPPGTSPPR